MTSNYVIPAFALPAAKDVKKGVTIEMYGKRVVGEFQGMVDAPLYLLKNGIAQNRLVEFARTSDGAKANYSDNKGALYLNGIGNVKKIGYVSNPTIDFTEYNFIYMRADGASSSIPFIFAVGQDRNTSAIDEPVKYTGILNENSGVTIRLNISALRGFYYLKVSADYPISSITYAYAFDIWLDNV